MLPVEVGEVSLWRHYFVEAENNKALQVDLGLIEQVSKDAVIMTKAYKQCMTRCFNSKLAPRRFEEGDLVWKVCGEAQNVLSDGKLAAKWEGPFRIQYNLKNESYKLEEISEKVILRTWNSTHLKVYYS